MINNKVKVLFIHHGSGIGGAPISLMNLVKRLDTERYDYKVAFVKGGVAEELFRDNGIPTEIINSSNNYFGHHEKGKIQIKYFLKYFIIAYHWYKTAYSWAPAYLKKNTEYDIVHLNSDVLSSWAFAAHKLSFKVVCHNRDPIAKGIFGMRRAILRNILHKSVDRFISISEDNKKRLGLLDKTDVVYNFIPIPNDFRPAFSDAVPPKILYLGGMAKVKGFDTVAQCLPYLDEGITLQIGGNLGRLSNGSTFKDKVKRWVKNNLYSSTYKSLEKVYAAPNAEVIGLIKNPLDYINACEILITPFKVEHFSRPAIEAFAYGKPVIGSNVEGMDEIIDNNVNGLLIEKNNPQKLAEAINYLCKNRDLAQQMGREGRKKAEKSFSPHKSTTQVQGIYKELIQEPQKR